MRSIAVFIAVAVAACVVCGMTDEDAIDYKMAKRLYDGGCIRVMRTRDNLEYSFDHKTRTLTISGTGPMDDYGIEDFPWCDYRTLARYLVIEEGVTSIGTNAFSFFSRLRNVTIPSSISHIEDNAFSDCPRLKGFSVDDGNNNFMSKDGVLYTKTKTLFKYPCHLGDEYTIEEGVTSINDFAFEDCMNLKAVTIPDGVEEIGSFAFSGCTSLSSVTIPKSVTSIGSGAFASCHSLNSFAVDGSSANYTAKDGVLCTKDGKTLVQYPGAKAGAFTVFDGVETILPFAFDGCQGLTSLSVPAGVTTVGESAFSNCKVLENATIKANVEEMLGVEAFFRSESLTSVELPENITFIGRRTFYECVSLENVVIPSRVGLIDQYAFYGCHSLTNMVIPSSVQNVDSNAFSHCDNLRTVTFEEGVREIGHAAFEDCESLTSVTIPSSVVSISNHVFSECVNLESVNILANIDQIPAGLFSRCNSLKSVNIPDTVTTISSGAFSGCTSLTEISLPTGLTSLGDSVFVGCSSLTDVTIPSGITTIKSYTFSGCGFENITIPSSINQISSFAFSECNSLKSATIPANVKIYGTGMFAGCQNLESINVESEDYFKSVDGVLYSKDEKTLYQYPCGKGNEFTVPEKVTNLYGSAFEGCKSLTKVTIANSGAITGESCFKGCTGLTDVTITTGYSRISSSTFYGCTSLTHVDIPSEITTIHSYAFMYSGLTSVDISSNIAHIYDGAFLGCKNLVSINVDEGNTVYKSHDGVLYSIEDSKLVQYPCGKGSSFTVPGNCSAIAGNAFSTCDVLTSVTISEGVTSIEANAFSDSHNLKRVTIPSSVSLIENGAFSGCIGLSLVEFQGYDEPQCAVETFYSCGALEVVCVAPNYTSSEFCGLTDFCKTSSCAKVEELVPLQNHCFEVYCSGSEPVLRMRHNATEWEKKQNACAEYKCDNETGPVKTDKCVLNNEYKLCYISECRDDGTCSNISLYSGNASGCAACNKAKGWEDGKKDCAEEVLNDPKTPSLINADTASCYDFVCVGDGICNYTAHDKCGKLQCTEEMCKSGKKCMPYTGCSEQLVDGVWTPQCVYDKKEGWQTVGCYEYNCDNESMIRSKCDKGDNIKRVCMNDNCVERDTLNSEGWMVEVVLDGVDVTELNVNDIVALLSQLSGIDASKIKVGTELDNGNTVLVVAVTDEKAANELRDVVNPCIESKGTNCSGVLQYVKALSVVPQKTYNSEASHVHLMGTWMMLLVVVLMAAMI